MFNITTTTTNSPKLTRKASQQSRLSGVALVPAGLCVYGDTVGAADVLRVNFDCDRIAHGGLYLVEALTDDGVAWMGCRRFERGIDGGLSVDNTGRGDWCEVADVAGLRVAGFVEQVYRAV